LPRALPVPYTTLFRSAAVVAQVQDHPLERLVVQCLEGVRQLVVRGLIELVDMEVSDAGPDHENVVETAARNLIARNGEIQRVIRAFTADRYLDHRTLGPLEHFGHAVGSQPL